MAFRVDCEIWAALRLIPKRQQRMVYRAYWGGNTEQQISVIFDIPLITVRRHLEQSRQIVKKYLEEVSIFGRSKTVVLVKGKSGTVDRGNRQRPDDKQKTLACIDRPAPSQNPSPDIYFESMQREDFMYDLAAVCSMAVQQVGSFRMDGLRTIDVVAAANRRRIHLDRIAQEKANARRAA